MNRSDIINNFIQKYNYKTYLEIGYYKGWSFDYVVAPFKVATDPNPSKTTVQEQLGYGTYLKTNDVDQIYKMTSDDFFQYLDTNNETELPKKFDIIFIDGLHEANQVYRDIMNALHRLNPGGTIVMHDCKPEQYNHVTTGDHAGNWLGDTYKAFIRFRNRFPEYETYVVDTDWGCGVIRTPVRDGGAIGWIDTNPNDLEIMLEWDYFDRNKKQLLDLISIEEFKAKLNEGTEDNNSPA